VPRGFFLALLEELKGEPIGLPLGIGLKRKALPRRVSLRKLCFSLGGKPPVGVFPKGSGIISREIFCARNCAPG